MTREKFIRLKPVAWLLRKLNPTYGTCRHCGVPWSHTEPHFANYKTHYGVEQDFFAVCEHCYRTMSDDELVQAYEDLWNIVWKDQKKPLSYVSFRSVYTRDIKARHK